MGKKEEFMDNYYGMLIDSEEDSQKKQKAKGEQRLTHTEQIKKKIQEKKNELQKEQEAKAKKEREKESAKSNFYLLCEQVYLKYQKNFDTIN